MAECSFPVHRDPRGALLAVEGADLGFPLARVFTVQGTPERLPRGGHVADCREVLVLVSGTVTGTIGPAPFALRTAGDSVQVSPGERIDFRLDEHSVLLVLCDQPFEARR